MHQTVSRLRPFARRRFSVWREIRTALRTAVGDSMYEVWLAPLDARECSGDILVVDAPAATHAWIAERFGRILESCAGAVLGRRVRVELAPQGDRSPRNEC